MIWAEWWGEVHSDEIAGLGWVAAQQSQQAAKGLRPAGTHSSTNRVLSPPAAAAHLRVRDVGDGSAAGARLSAEAAVVVGHHALHRVGVE